MGKVLVDTSVWIDFFRNGTGRDGDELDTLLAEDRVLLFGVIEMEIFQGLKKKELAEIQSVFDVLPYVDTTRADFIAAGALWKRLRESGKTIPATDCLIAAVCLSRDFTLFSLDKHFDEIGELRRFKRKPIAGAKA